MRAECRTCKFWEKFSFAEGECRFNAPAVFPYKDNASGENFVREWPVTHYGDWCGKHEAAPVLKDNPT